MDIRVLRYFLTVAKVGNITRAAEMLHIAQPSLSKQMMDLEMELGKQLLIRGKRQVTLTEDGILLAKRSEEIIHLFDKTEQELTSSTEEIIGEIHIGGSIEQAILDAASTLRKTHPQITYHFHVGDANDVIERLDHGSLDFVVLYEPIDSVKYEYLPLYDEAKWGLLLPNDCELAKKQCIEPEDLLHAPIIMHQRIGLQRMISLWANKEISELNVVATYNVINCHPSVLVQSGLGYYLTTENIKIDNEKFTFSPLYPNLISKHALVWKRHQVLSKAAIQFLKEMKKD